MAGGVQPPPTSQLYRESVSPHPEVIAPAAEIDVLMEQLEYLFACHGPVWHHEACQECRDRATIIRLLMKRFAKAEGMAF